MPTIDDIAERVAQYYVAHENEWAYSLASDRMNPEVARASNCSALIWWAAHVCAPGSDLDRLGHGYTGTFARYGKAIQRGTQGQHVDRSLLRPLDMLLVDRGSYTEDYDHVELYLGQHGRGSELWGAGSAPLPHRSASLEAWCDTWSRWMVVRFEWGASEEDDMTEDQDRMLRAVYNALCVPSDASGRGKEAAVADRLAWMAAKQESIMDAVGVKRS